MGTKRGNKESGNKSKNWCKKCQAWESYPNAKLAKAISGIDSCLVLALTDFCIALKDDRREVK